MSGSLSLTAWVVILLVVIFVVIINLGLFTLAHKRGDKQLNASTTFKRVATMLPETRLNAKTK